MAASQQTCVAEDGEAVWRSGRRGRVGWYCYDGANSVFATTVISIFFGPFITDVCERAADAQGYLHPLGIPVLASSFFPFLVGLSVLLQIFVLPTAAALTERFDKGVLLGALGFCGAGAGMGMYTIGETDYLLGGTLFAVATMALGAANTVANTYLPALAPPERRDRTSTQASATGFLCGGVVLMAALLVYARHESWGMTESEAVRLIMLGAGAWWLVFGAVSVRLLRGYGAPPAATPDTMGPSGRAGTYRALFAAVRQMRSYPGAIWFLVAFLLYNNGMQSVTSLVGTFAVEELGLKQDDVVTAVLAVQFVAFVGAIVGGRLAERYGGRNVLLGFVVVWFVAVVAGATIPERSAAAFTTLCVGAGFVVGGTYALSRSVFVSLVPRERAAEYFGIFETVNRCLAFLGPAAFGFVLQWTGSYRVAWLSILVFFLAGALALVLGSVAGKGRERRQKEMTHG
ncbi:MULTISPECIES: MFS transporter [unclassified Streptomyces]|uniref:MFS transporter n=1 Tax=unclassified Streptomyces TaxID=2593676 RepID=UPI002E772130|nr:MFS transporter [Streptomyces sp. JV176]MEE1803257.1 MFS transporter [Streptomyces sp. JV176]